MSLTGSSGICMEKEKRFSGSGLVKFEDGEFDGAAESSASIDVSEGESSFRKAARNAPGLSDNGMSEDTSNEEISGSALEFYCNSVINSLLKLRLGDSLIINVDECDFSLARELANRALLITKIQVKIVVIRDNKPVDIVEFDPDLSNVKPFSNVLLRIEHIHQNNIEKEDKSKKILDTFIAVEKDDLKVIQKAGHLAEPVIPGRRIGVAFSVVPSVTNCFNSNIEREIENIDYVTAFLNSKDIDILHFTDKKTGTDLKIGVPEENIFINQHITLYTGRDFVSNANYKAIRCTLDSLSAEGTLRGKAEVFGSEMEVEFQFKDGEISSYRALNDDSDISKLDKLLSFDPDLRKAGYLTMEDTRFKLYLGGSVLECLKTEAETIEDLPKHFNTCLYSLCVELPNDINIESISCNGESTELVRRGFIIV